ncbi:hypothetical protein ACIHFE_34475 [Streptomyces sp. NPDC052396]
MGVTGWAVADDVLVSPADRITQQAGGQFAGDFTAGNQATLMAVEANHV